MRNIFLSTVLLTTIALYSFVRIDKPVYSANNTLGLLDDTFIRGADLSFLPMIRQTGTVFYDANGHVTDPLILLKKNGCNTVRIRLWNNPSDAHSSIGEVIAFSREVKASGMKVWLDFHYSDNWADPGKQAKPAAWANLSNEQLSDSVYVYTKRVMRIIRPDYVQIGNEINNGILWPNGSMKNPHAFITFVKSGIKAARETNASTKIIIHYAGYNGASDFYSLLRRNNVDYDIIGLSYYPMWHGKNLDSLSNIMKGLVADNHKSIVIAETAYPFTLKGNDYTNNEIGDTSQIIAKTFAPTPEGQKAFLLKLRSIVQLCPRGRGFCYWAPDWIAFDGTTSKNGSGGENLALFDFDNKVLPAMGVYNK